MVIKAANSFMECLALANLRSHSQLGSLTVWRCLSSTLPCGHHLTSRSEKFSSSVTKMIYLFCEILALNSFCPAKHCDFLTWIWMLKFTERHENLPKMPLICKKRSCSLLRLDLYSLWSWGTQVYSIAFILHPLSLYVLTATILSSVSRRLQLDQIILE